ncbi:MAG: hypothetical protein KC493_15930 [Bacteriovoracaceae bacterium]|nr:hypothetical protein [Bacteriovoracaceae bacterium]
MNGHIAIIDCAISEPSIKCVNRMGRIFGQSMTYHSPSWFGIESLRVDKPKAWIIFGSYSNVEDKYPWQLNLQSFMQEQILKGVPTLGICFGHQLMADAFGAKVVKNSKDKCLSGPREVKVLRSHMGLKKNEAITMMTQHRFHLKNLPKDFIHIGESKNCKYDIIAHRSLPYISYQGHPEASRHFIESNMEKPASKQDIEMMNQGGDYVISRFFESMSQI